MSVKPARTRTGIGLLSYPAGLTVTLGQMTESPHHGWAVFGAMAVLWFAGVFTCYWAESQPSPLLHGIDQRASVNQAGGNMEGKEVRFGHCELGALRHRDHGRELRRREFHARFLYAVGRHGADGEHPARGSGL
jgi:hypothetical protein